MGLLDSVAGVAGDLGSALGLGGDAGPEPDQIQINPETKKLMSAQLADAQRPVEDFYKDKMYGVENEFMGAMRNPGNQGTSPEVGQAIKNRYAEKAKLQLQGLKAQSLLGAYDTKSRQLSRSIDSQQMKNNIDAENKRRLMEYEIRKDQARSQAVSSVLGIGMMAAGFAVGGPLGAGLVAGGAGSVRGGVK